MSYNPASVYDAAKGFAKPEWPVIDESITSPVTTLWEQDPASWRDDCCIARKIRADRDLRFDVSVSLSWQCGKKNAPGSNVCPDCGANKIKFETTKQCHPTWNGIMTEAPPKHTEVFYKGVYRFSHPKKVTPVFKHTERVIEKRTKLTDEEKAARAAAKDGPRKITAAALDDLIAQQLLAEYKNKMAMSKGKAGEAAVTKDWEKRSALATAAWDAKEAERIAKKEEKAAAAEKKEEVAAPPA